MVRLDYLIRQICSNASIPHSLPYLTQCACSAPAELAHIHTYACLRNSHITLQNCSHKHKLSIQIHTYTDLLWSKAQTPFNKHALTDPPTHKGLAVRHLHTHTQTHTHKTAGSSVC